MTKPKIMLSSFLRDHLPKTPELPALPNWQDNLPKWPPATPTLGPPVSELKKDQTLLDAYFGGDVMLIENDMLRRPDHYTTEQKEIIAKVKSKEPLPPGASYRDINDIVFRFVESTRHQEQRRDVVQKVQKKISDSDPTVERKNEEEAAHVSRSKSDDQGFIKII